MGGNNKKDLQSSAGTRHSTRRSFSDFLHIHCCFRCCQWCYRDNHSAKNAFNAHINKLSSLEISCGWSPDFDAVSWDVQYDFALSNVNLQLKGITGDLIRKLFVGNAVVPITINVAVLNVCTIAV